SMTEAIEHRGRLTPQFRARSLSEHVRGIRPVQLADESLQSFGRLLLTLRIEMFTCAVQRTPHTTHDRAVQTAGHLVSLHRCSKSIECRRGPKRDPLRVRDPVQRPVPSEVQATLEVEDSMLSLCEDRRLPGARGQEEHLTCSGGAVQAPVGTELQCAVTPLPSGLGHCDRAEDLPLFQIKLEDHPARGQSPNGAALVDDEFADIARTWDRDTIPHDRI